MNSRTGDEYNIRSIEPDGRTAFVNLLLEKGVTTQLSKLTFGDVGLPKKMAHPKRFELLTPRFVVWCSIQLSYGCVSLR